jgi:hypothetical protein
MRNTRISSSEHAGRSPLGFTLALLVAPLVGLVLGGCTTAGTGAGATAVATRLPGIETAVASVAPGVATAVATRVGTPRP